MGIKDYVPIHTCIGVKGFNRGIIYDFQRTTYDIVPNSYINFLNKLKIKSFRELFKNTSLDNRKVLSDYLSFSLEKEYLQEIPKNIKKSNFPELNICFKTPSLITNISIIYGLNNIHSTDKIVELIEITKCYHLQLIFEKKNPFKTISQILTSLKTVGLRSIELIIPYEQNVKYTDELREFYNLSFVYIYSAPKRKLIKKHYYGMQLIYLSDLEFKLEKNKTLSDFKIDLSLYMESKLYNNFFNRKLTVDSFGDIKNWFKLDKVYGNLNKLNKFNLLQEINNLKHTNYWGVKKDIIDVCKQCEFRYMCVDSRIPIKRSNKEWYFETECNYNPYISKWKGEDGYKSLVDCGIKSDKFIFKINRNKLNKINKELWGKD